MTLAFRLLALGTLVNVTGCATTPVSSASAKSVPSERIYAFEMTKSAQDRGLLIVTRDKGMMGAACAARLYLDETHVADLRTSEQVWL
jgi:hypothetical protein